MKKKELIIIAVLAVLIALMDMAGILSVYFVNINIGNIDPMYVTLMVNFLIIGVVAYLVLKFLCLSWELDLGKRGLQMALKSME